MKKSTIIMILIVYFVSIIGIGFFGMSVKVYDEIKYVKSIEIEVGASPKEMIVFSYKGKDTSTGDNKYNLRINFNEYKIKDIDDKFIASVNLIPHVTYDTGDAAGQAEEIEFKIESTTDWEGTGHIKLHETGRLDCFDSGFSFKIRVSPKKSSGLGTSAVITVFVR